MPAPPALSNLEAEVLCDNNAPLIGELLKGHGLNMQGHSAGEQWRCAHCTELIGAYEPMVTVEDGQARRTSRTAELRAGRLASEPYHRACYLLEHREPLAE